MTPLEEFARLLDELNLGTYSETTGGDVFFPALPDAPDVATSVTRYGAGESDSLQGWDEINLQFRCRGAKGDSRVAEQRAQAIYDALHGLGMRTLPGGTWLQLMIGLQGGPIYIGRDPVGRHEWTINLRAELKRPTANRT